MAFADAEGARIYYEQHGSGPAVMLIHGSGGHHMAWWRQVAYLARFFTVLTIDLRGFGNSTPVEGGPDSLDFVKDVEAVLDASSVERCALLGQSIGALSALRVAVRRPQQIAAVLLAHSIGGINDAELADLVATDRREAEKLPMLDRLLTKEFQSGQPALTFLFRQMGTFNHAKMADLRNLSARGPGTDEISAAGIKVIFLCGERDSVLRSATVRRAHEKVPGSRLAVVPNGPHSLYWEMPEVFNATVHQLLNEVYGCPGTHSPP
jgi:pimeloyl-ACP methyl ester carboxylesterase